MKFQLPAEKDLIKSIRQGIPLLTVNARLSRYLRSEFEDHMIKKGETVWETPLIIPLQAWLKTLWEKSWPGESLISDLCAGTLWEGIVTGDELFANGDILMPQGVVKSSFDAYNLMMAYRLELSEDDNYLKEEAEALRRWTTAYRKSLKRLHSIDCAMLAMEITALIRRGKIELPTEVILAGFDELTPQQLEIIKVVEESGTKVTFWPVKPLPKSEAAALTGIKGRLSIRSYDSEVEEVIQAARWVRKIYRPGVRIGIIVPDLNRYRGIIRREFAAELDPASLLPGRSSSGIFNISLGSTLYDEPIVRSALAVISLRAGSQDISLISSILLSPYIAGSKEDRLRLARLDAELKKNNRTTISLAGLRQALGYGEYDAPLFSAGLDILIKSVEKGDEKKAPSGWAEEFSNLLTEIGWPSREVAINSEEYQSLSAWGETLSSLASLDDITGRLTRNEAVGRLMKMTREKLYQPETPDSPVEVMGLLEASGLHFDHLWLLGADEETLPGLSSPNPFIPINLQKKHDLPRSSSERELYFAKWLIKRLSLSIPGFEVSWSKNVENREIKLSPLLKESGQIEESVISEESRRYKDAVQGAGTLEESPPDAAIPVAGGELEKIQGGTFILKNQSDCPFRAFALHRLSAVGIETPLPGITSMERGSIVHKAMEQFWRVVKGSERLKELMDNGGIGEIISESAEAGIRAIRTKRKGGGPYMALEKERLESLIKEWTGIEAVRGDFVARETEAEGTFVAGRLKLKGRIDRIDDLEGGGRVLIDYKTGGSDPNDWLTERPRDPQLMLYSMTDDFDAVSFARLKRGGCRFAGIAREEGTLPGVKPFGSDAYSRKVEGAKEWEGLMESWRETVTMLAEEFIEGKADADPRDYGTEKSACRYCEQKILCRIFEREE